MKKKYPLLLILFIVFLLTACASKQQEHSSGEHSSQVEDESGTEEKTPTEKEKDDGDLYDIELNHETNALELKKEGTKTIVLADNQPSEPINSPNGEYAVYLAPFEWEEISDLFLVNLKDGSQKKLVEGNSESKPKKVIWEDDKHVLVIIGYPYGTVSVGGNIYRVDIETGEKEALTKYIDDFHITDFQIEDGTLHYSGIQYIDEGMNEYKDYTNQISLEE